MPIFPSGNRKIMVAQQVPQTMGPDIGDDAAAAAKNMQLENRRHPKQETVVDQGGQPAEIQQQPKNTTQDVAQDSIVQDDTMKQDQKTEGSDGELKDYIFNKLQSLGVQPRQLKEQEDTIFELVQDLSSRTQNGFSVRGFYLIPTYTTTQKINQKMAVDIATEIGKKFGLSQKMKIQGNAYRVDFQSNEAQETSTFGTSFDNLAGGKSQQKKAASTIHEMLKTSKNKLFDTLTKNG